MSVKIDSKDYINYLKNVYDKLLENKDYITELDLATGDGDHWVNMNLGFEEIIKQSEDLIKLDIQDLFKKISMILMSKIGGSSGVLYGGAYMAASKTMSDIDYLTIKNILNMWEAMLEDIMKRGKTEIGSKTMVDALAPAVEVLKEEIKLGTEEKDALKKASEASVDGAKKTKDMPAIRGRASYQTDKGIGHLDPGAVTMSYQIEELCNYIVENK